MVAARAIEPPELAPVLAETPILEVFLLVELICFNELLLWRYTTSVALGLFRMTFTTFACSFSILVF